MPFLRRKRKSGTSLSIIPIVPNREAIYRPPSVPRRNLSVRFSLMQIAQPYFHSADPSFACCPSEPSSRAAHGIELYRHRQGGNRISRRPGRTGSALQILAQNSGFETTLNCPGFSGESSDSNAQSIAPPAEPDGEPAPQIKPPANAVR